MSLSSKRMVNRRRVLWLLLLAALTIALLLALGGVRTTLAAVTQADARLIALGLLVHYSGFVARGHRWQLLLRSQGYDLAYRRVLTVLLNGWFVSALLPARAGDAFRVGLLHTPISGDEPAIPVADGLGSIVLERGLDIVALLVLSVTFGFTVLGGQVPGWLVGAYVTVVALILGALLILFFTPALIPWLRRLVDYRLWHAALSFAAQTLNSLRRLPRRPAVIGLVAAESLYIWLCDGLLLWAVIGSLGRPLPLTHAGFVALTVDIFAAVPITPGGLGQIESFYAALLALLPPPAFPIAATILLFRGITYYSFLLWTGPLTFATGFGHLRRGVAHPSVGEDAPNSPTQPHREAGV